MNKPKMILVAICFLAAAGGALASKARRLDGFIFKGGVYVPQAINQNCPRLAAGCKYTSVDDATFQFYTKDASGVYNSVAPPLP